MLVLSAGILFTFLLLIFMRRTFTLVLALLLCVNLIYSQNQRIVCDETCKIEAGFDTAQSKSGGNYAVVSPVGRSSVKMIQQAPRLETLEGKTIAIVGESFMTHVTHPELKRLILKNYPTAKVILLDEIGEAGVYAFCKSLYYKRLMPSQSTLHTIWNQFTASFLL